MNYIKVIIIAPPRSGTNMMRNCLLKLNNSISWDCDEINPIWKYDNYKIKHDELKITDINNKNYNFIKKKFDNLHKKNNSEILIEKTCANSLRIPFVKSIFPEAKYLFLVRNGHDTVNSSILRWQAPLDIKYTLKKIKYMPISSINSFGLNFIKSRFSKIFSKDNSLSMWGARYKDMEIDVKNETIDYVCARQWSKCIEYIVSNYNKNNNEILIKYENFVSNPYDTLKQILDQFNIKNNYELLSNAVSDVKKRNLNSLTKYKLNNKSIELIQNFNSKLGY